MTPGRVSRAIVADKAALIRRLLDEAGTLPLDDLDVFTRDPRMVAAGESYLRRTLEALLDISRHVLAKGFARAPSEYGEVARQLGEVGVVSPSRTERLVRMARYRNRLVHVYHEVTAPELYELLVRRRGDIEEMLGAIADWMAAHPDRVADPE
jgi:uncharacterized protein YutE (UPF0331/DUF86 family)